MGRRKRRHEVHCVKFTLWTRPLSDPLWLLDFRAEKIYNKNFIGKKWKIWPVWVHCQMCSFSLFLSFSLVHYCASKCDGKFLNLQLQIIFRANVTEKRRDFPKKESLPTGQQKYKSHGACESRKWWHLEPKRFDVTKCARNGHSYHWTKRKRARSISPEWEVNFFVVVWLCNIVPRTFEKHWTATRAKQISWWTAESPIANSQLMNCRVVLLYTEST